MKIGFCCKMSELHGSGTRSIPELNTRTTTVAWLNRQTETTALDRLTEIVKHNTQSVLLLVQRVAQFPEPLRMIRLSSDILPMYTHPVWKRFYQNPDIISMISGTLQQAGVIARAHGVRVSMHPGQFTVLASEEERIRLNSIEEFEYHADIARWMGYGERFQDMKINVHISGRGGPALFRDSWSKLSSEARNCITVENEEFGEHGLEACLSLSDICPVVLDTHHHWVRTGEYLNYGDPRVAQVIESWRGVRPAMHYSQPRQELVTTYTPTDAHLQQVSMDAALASGVRRVHLRAHSDYFWNETINDMTREFGESFDIQCEVKWKNIASFDLAKKWGLM